MEIQHDRLCRKIVEECGLAVIFAGRDGRIQLWNRACERMFGFTAAEAVGQSMDIIIPEKHRAKHWEGYDAVMKSGVTKYGSDPLAVPALTKDGRRISIEFHIVLVRDDVGQVLGAGAILQDVSARWERDKALRQKLAALEEQLKKAAAAK